MSGAAQVTPVEPAPQTAPARKRRRRATATGAASDCFTCVKKEVKCDRARPFCGQCLAVGKQCSGYITPLTWNNGLASRGKFRGLSLPVLTQPSKSKAMSKSPSSAAKRPRSATKLPEPAEQVPAQTSEAHNGQDFPNKRRQQSTSPKAGNDAPECLHRPPSATVANHRSGSSPNIGWLDPPPGHNLPQNGQHASFTSQPQPLRGLYASVDASDHRPSLTSSRGSFMSSVSGTEYGDRPFERPFTVVSTPDDSQFVDPFARHYDLSSFKAPGHRPILHSSQPERFRGYQDTRSPSPSSSEFHNSDSSGVTQSQFDNGYELIMSPLDGSTAFDFAVIGSQGMAEFEFQPPNNIVPVNRSSFPFSQALTPSIFKSSLDMPFPHMPRRLRYFLDYYDKAICPVLVASDGPYNPYRMHIIPLAMQNAGLQNAIAALVTNNIRMRDVTHAPRSNEWDNETSSHDQLMSLSPSSPTPEEQYHKAMSIEHLNSQLPNMAKASDDAVLATLLILCLFHVCNSGFSKFKTQLAGVQKLLKMRTNGTQTGFVSWVEMFFAWFDVMTSAVNDRETEIRGDSLGMDDLSAKLTAIEQFSGCEGRLFKLIARLGRLNLLSQNRPVRDVSGGAYRPDHDVHLETDMMTVEDFYFFHRNTEHFHRGKSDTLAQPGREPSDTRDAFWREWQDVRTRLQAWEADSTMDALTTNNKNNNSAARALPQRHLVAMSEAFRYSALLYTERLAYPSLPSSSPNFQRLVASSLAHIDDIGVQSCVTKFMLWPLFITGTECVEGRHRDLIRDRCVEIQKESGFYNNLSGLKVLERVWREGDMEWEEGAGEGRWQAFRWRRAMDRVDGEYIVI